MSQTDLSKWALLAKMALEHFPEDADVSQALAIAEHFADWKRAGATKYAFFMTIA
jgi:hypothetical protein